MYFNIMYVYTHADAVWWTTTFFACFPPLPQNERNHNRTPICAHLQDARKSSCICVKLQQPLVRPSYYVQYYQHCSCCAFSRRPGYRRGDRVLSTYAAFNYGRIPLFHITNRIGVPTDSACIVPGCCLPGNRTYY